jgi:hypothetical protein
MLLKERFEIRFSEYLDRLLTGINLNSNRRRAKVYLVASSVRRKPTSAGLSGLVSPALKKIGSHVLIKG